MSCLNQLWYGKHGNTGAVSRRFWFLRTNQSHMTKSARKGTVKILATALTANTGRGQVSSNAHIVGD